MSLTDLIYKNIGPRLKWEQIREPLVVILKIVLIIAAAYLVIRLVDRVIVRALKLEERRNPRLQTVSRLLQSVVLYVICFIAGIIILQALNIPTGSLLASAGILGLVVGLGAQSLIKDIISGFFIIVEDQYMVGDYIEVGSLRGFVKEIGLRATRLTDWGGEVHIIPNGQIDKVTNHSRSDRRAQIDIYIPYQENLDQVMAILEQVAEEFRREGDYITEGPTVLGVVEFGPTTLTIRIVAMTEPMRQWELERAVRARIKQRFEQEGIILPSFPASWIVKGESYGGN